MTKLNVNSNDSPESNGAVKIQWTVPQRIPMLTNQEEVEAKIDQLVKEAIRGWKKLDREIFNDAVKDSKFGGPFGARTGHLGGHYAGCGKARSRYDDAVTKLFSFTLYGPEYAKFPFSLGPERGCYPESRRDCRFGSSDAAGDSAEELSERPESDG